METKELGMAAARRDPSRAGSGPVRRRTEDAVVDLLFAGPVDEEPGAAVERVLELTGYKLDGRSLEVAPLPGLHISKDEAVLLLDLGGEEALLVVGAAVRRLPRGDGARDLLTRAASGALAWRREQLRAERQRRLPERLLAYSERLGSAAAAEEVQRALVEHAAQIVGAYAAILLVWDEETGLLRMTDASTPELEVYELGVPGHSRFAGPGLLTAADAGADTGAPFPELAPLFRTAGAVVVAHHPLGDHGVLLLLERRRDHVLEPEDWDLLRALCRQASSALERIRLLAEVRQLSLTDPLTGLANRRHLNLVLERSFAAARRGEPLTVVMIDLDGFKAINDRFGHTRGDRTLSLVASCLESEARATDLVARYGGDEFVLVLPGGTPEGAEALLQRVRDRLGGQIRLSAGIAEYQPGVRSAEHLIETADRQLYQGRYGSGGPPGDWTELGNGTDG